MQGRVSRCPLLRAAPPLPRGCRVMRWEPAWRGCSRSSHSRHPGSSLRTARQAGISGCAGQPSGPGLDGQGGQLGSPGWRGRYGFSGQRLRSVGAGICHPVACRTCSCQDRQVLFAVLLGKGTAETKRASALFKIMYCFAAALVTPRLHACRTSSLISRPGFLHYSETCSGFALR